jgi:transcriptional regulator with XRE-family HTH domain
MRRESIGLSQQELGVLAGLARTYLSDVECGARNISLRTLCLLSAALEIPPSELLIETETAIERRKRRKR